MASGVKPVPEGHHTVNPYLMICGAARAIDFYKSAFGAQELFRMEAPNGKIGHATLRIGDSIVMLSDEMSGDCTTPQTSKGTAVNMYLYVEEVDRVFKQAVDAGAKVDMPLADMFWGDRYAKVTDPFGHSWSLATHKEDLKPEELRKRTQAAMEKMA